MARIQHSRSIVSIAALLVLFLALLGWRHHGTMTNNVKVSAKFTAKPHKHAHKKPPTHLAADRPHKEKLAYVTWLSSTVLEDNKKEELDEDVYFIATRILVYQLLHAPETRTTHDIDVIVLVTPDVTESRKDRLKQDGAIVKPVDFVHTANDGWIHPLDDRWVDNMAKLRIWEMTEYSRLLMLDGDTILLKPLDGVFEVPAAKLASQAQTVDLEEDEPKLPKRYLFASVAEVEGTDHDFPPTWDHDFKHYGRFNAGFFLLKPSLDMFNYYKSLLDKEGRFNPMYPEQNLLNYAHRWNGPMPWKEIPPEWNIKDSNENDIEKGLASMHEKWWTDPRSGSEEMKKLFIRIRWQMEGFYQALDEARESNYNCSQWSSRPIS